MVFSTTWEIINAVAARTQLFHYSLICSEPMHTPYGDIPDRLARDMRGRYHADGTGPAEATDDRTGRELAELPPGPRGEVVQYPSTDRCFALQVAAPFLMQAAPGRSVPSPEPSRGQRRVATRSPDQPIPIYQGTR
jgi:hypothetical protein